MTLRNVPKAYTLEQQRQEVNLIAADLDTAVDGAQTFGGNKEFTGTVTFTNDVTLSSTTGNVIVGSDDNPSAIFNIYAGTSPGSTNYFTFSASSNEAYIRNIGGSGSGGGINIEGRSGVGIYSNSYLCLWAKSTGEGVLLYQTLEKLSTSATGATVTGTLVADEFSGPVTGDVTGNADTATALETARNIAGQSFDGTADITIAATDLSDTDQSLATTSDVTFNTITKAGGTSTEFLKADGSVDTTTYLSSYTETDPVFSASEAASITSTDTTNWDTAYGWGDHGAAGYLTTETDPVVGAITGIIKADGAGNISAAVAGTDYATAAQGALADTALQAETITLTTLKAEVAAATDFADFQARIAAL